MKTYKELLNKRDPIDRQILKYIKDDTLIVGVVGVKEPMKNER